MAAPERTVSLSELAAQHLSRNKDLRSSTPASSDTLLLGLLQSSRALPLLLPPTPTASGFCLSCPQTAIIQHSPGVDADVRPKMTAFKGFFPSLGELFQDHLDHSSTTFKSLTSVRTETMAAPDRTASLSGIAAQHLTKDKDLTCSVPAIIRPVNSGGRDTLFLGLQDLSKALAPLLSPTSSPPVFSLSSPHALISQYSPGVDADIRPKVTSLKGFPSLPESLQDHSNHRFTAYKPLTSAQPEAIADKRMSQHLSMDIDLQRPATTLIFSETTSASPSSLGTSFCLSSSLKRSRQHQSESKVRAGTPPRCPSLTPAMFYLPPIQGDSPDTPNGAISAAVSKQQKTQERKLKKEDVLVLWPGQIEVVKTNTFYQVLYHPLPKFTNRDPQRPLIVPFKFDTPSPDDIALERRQKPYTRKKKSYCINRRLNQA